MLEFSDEEDHVIVVTNQDVPVGKIMQQDGCGGWMFLSLRPLCYPDLKRVVERMAELHGVQVCPEKETA